MFLVVSFGIGLLVIATKKSLFRVHRSVAGLGRNSVQTIKDDLTKKATQYRCEPAKYLITAKQSFVCAYDALFTTAQTNRNFA